MADTVQLKVNLNQGTVIAQLKEIDEKLSSIQGKSNIKIKIGTSTLTRAANQSEKLAQNITKLEQAGAAVGDTATQAGTKAAKAMTQTAAATEKAQKSTNLLGKAFGNLTKMAYWQISGKLVSAAFQAFGDGLATMKEVDSQLVSIRKVTNLTEREIAGLTDTAYSLASAYGRTADEVLNASVTFARAGYGEQIEQLSELSLLLQNVGDLNAADASQFLIATDAAYKLGGSYTDLMTVIDGLNEITNRNATDMQKMTDGMTVAGSVFAQSGESIETFAALLGTATANTQRSGAEMARGLRTILMNLRQIRGETEDGELIDGESIANASKALKEYANVSTMENGQLRKASDVLRELAGRWDDLDSVAQSAIAEAVAGKRQANVLTSILGDWDSVEKMIAEYTGAAGSAMEENQIYLDSWEAKTSQIKASWTELMSDFVSTDFIKGGLDAVNALIQGIDTLFDTAADREKDATKTAQELAEAYEADYGAGSRYQQLRQDVDNLTAAERVELAILEQRKTAREEELGIAERDLEVAQQRAQSERDSRGLGDANLMRRGVGAALSNYTYSGDEEGLIADLSQMVASYADLADEIRNARDAGEELGETENAMLSSYDALSGAVANAENVYIAYGEAVRANALLNGATTEQATAAAQNAVMELAAQIGEVPESPEVTFNSNAPEATSEAQALKAAADEAAGTYSIVFNVQTNGSIPKVGGGTFLGGGARASGTDYAPGGPTLVNEEGPEVIAVNGLAWIAGGGRPTITSVPRGATIYNAQETRALFSSTDSARIPAFKSGTSAVQEALDYFAGNGSGSVSTSSGSSSTRSGNGLWVTGKDGKSGGGLLITGSDGKSSGISLGGSSNGASGSSGSGGGGGGGGGKAPPDFKALEESLKDTLKNLDLQAELAENQEDFLKAMGIYGKAQNEINKLLKQYRANGYAATSTEVLTLLNKGYDYAGKQDKDYDKIRDNLIDALEDLTRATDDANELASRQEAVDKAREALANAQRQRTVRVFNPVTGQWEWVANAGDIQSAQENLKNAEEALQKEQIDQSISALKNSTGSIEDVPISQALWDLMASAPGETQSALLSKWGAAITGGNNIASAETTSPFRQTVSSIGTQYNFGDISLTEAQAANMTVKELADQLRALKIM